MSTDSTGRRANADSGEKSRLCYVIMPFSATKSCSKAEWTSIFANLIKPAVEGAGLGYECRRSEATRGNIIGAIIHSLYAAHVVIADLTDQNPNVFYELGVRHALRDRTILLAQSHDFLPFDLRPYATHVYDWKDSNQQQKLTAKLRELLADVDAKPDRPDNPVSDFLRHPARSDSQTKESPEQEVNDAIRESEESSYDIGGTYRSGREVLERVGSQLLKGRDAFGFRADIAHAFDVSPSSRVDERPILQHWMLLGIVGTPQRIHPPQPSGPQPGTKRPEEPYDRYTLSALGKRVLRALGRRPEPRVLHD